MSGSWSIRVRIPAWTTGATISVNGMAQNVTTTPGSYATVTRTWAAGDTVTVACRCGSSCSGQRQRQRRRDHLRPGGAVRQLRQHQPPLPSLNVSSITRTSASALAFTATANGSTVNLGPFYDAHGFNYTVYWSTTGGGNPGGGSSRLVNVGSGLVLGIQNMSTADGGLALQWGDTGTADHNWVVVTDGDAVRFRNVNSGKVLGVENMSTADNARVLQWADNGTADHRWVLLDQGDGTYKIRNVNSGKLLGILNGSTAQGAQAVQDSDNGSADNRWRIVANQ